MDIATLDKVEQELNSVLSSEGDEARRMAILKCIRQVQDLKPEVLVPEPPGRYHLYDNSVSIEVCDTATPSTAPCPRPLGAQVAEFQGRNRRELAWSALIGMNMDAVTRRKVEYLMNTPKAKPVGVILVLPNLSRAYVDMGRVEYNTVPNHNPLSIKRTT